MLGTNERFIGREREIKELNRFYQSGRSEFVAVYGRRRVGKTFLIRTLFGSQFTFYASGVLNGTKQNEMDSFCNALKEYGYEGSRPTSWMEAFSALADLINEAKDNERCILFLDEISSFDTPKSGFLLALEHFWNVKASAQSNVLLIISGSATQWIINKVLNDKGGLHNRVTRQIHLQPFTLKEVEEYGKCYKSPWQRIHYIQAYSILGGIPYYWDKLDLQDTVEANIDNLFFRHDGELVNEYRNLYRSIYRNPEPYLTVIKLLAANQSGLTRKEISEQTKMESGSHLTQILQDLENCDFIRSYRNRTKSNNLLYQLIDFYTLFHFHFEARIGRSKDFWKKNMQTPTVSTWNGLSFERICLIHTNQILHALHLDTINTEQYSWKSKRSEPGAQIDLVIDRADFMTTLCEIKYAKGLYRIDKEEYLKIVNRGDAYQSENTSRKGIQWVLMTTFGITNSEYSSIFHKVLDANALFSE